MWKAQIGKEVKNGSNVEDDWETDADFVNNISEKESRWGSKTVAGSGHQESVDINSLRQGALASDAELKKRQLETMPKPSLGYGGKFGVQQDRMDKSAETWQYKGETEKHVSQKDYARGFGGKFGVESDRQDKSAAGWEHKEQVPLHESQKDYVKGFGGKFGVQKDRQDKSAVGWDHKEQLSQHESQIDYSKGFGGKFGVQSDRKDKSAVGWEHREELSKHDSQKDYAKGFGGKFGVEADRQDKSAAGWDHQERVPLHESQTDHSKGFGGKYGVQTDRKDKSAADWNEGENERKKSQPTAAATAVEVEKGRASNLRARFEQLAAHDPDQDKKRIAEEQERRRKQDEEDKRKQKELEEQRQLRLKQQHVDDDEDNEERKPRPLTLNYAEDQQQHPRSPVSPQPMSPTRVAHQLLPAQHKHVHGLPIGAVSVLPRPAPPVEDDHASPAEHAPAQEIRTPTEDLKQALAHKMRRPPTPQSDEDVDEPPSHVGHVEQAPAHHLLASVIKGSAPVEAHDDEFNDYQVQSHVQYHRESDHYEEPQYRQADQSITVEQHPLAEPTHPMADTHVTAVAMYDYQAADDDEISFEPDDIITNIEMVDAGWWRGECHGKYGLFPANYVELRPQ